MTGRKYPPFTELGMLSLSLIVIGGIYLSSHIPQHVALGPAIGLLVASAAVMVVNLVLLSRVQGFAWPRFFQVAKWALLAYLFTAGMILYAFLATTSVVARSSSSPCRCWSMRSRSRR